MQGKAYNQNETKQNKTETEVAYGANHQTIPNIKRVEYGENFMRILSSFTRMCSKCAAFNYSQYIAQSARQFCALYRVKDGGICFQFCKRLQLLFV